MALINLSLNKQTYIPNYRLRICILTTLIFLSYLIYSFHWVFILPFLMINFYIFYIVSGITSLKLNFETSFLNLLNIFFLLNIFLFFTYHTENKQFYIIIPAYIYTLFSIFKHNYWHQNNILPLISIPYIIHVISFKSSQYTLKESFAIGLILSLSLLPIFRIYKTIQYKDWKILYTNDITQIFIIQFILIERIISNYSGYNINTILLILFYKSTLFLQRMTLENNSNFFSSYLEENIIKKDVQNAYLKTIVLSLITVSILLTTKSENIGNILYVYVLLVITYYNWHDKFKIPQVGKIAILTNEEIKISYEQIASLNLLHFSDKNIYSRGYRKLLHPSIQADFLEITKSVKSIIVVNMQNTDVLKNCKNNKDISFYYIFDNVPNLIKNHSSLYNYNNASFNLFEFLQNNNVNGAIELEEKVIFHRTKNNQIYNKQIGLQDLHHLRKQIINIGDIQLRVLANINFIEMNLRYYYFVNTAIENIIDENIHTVSMGIMISKIREHFHSHFINFSHLLNDENHLMWKTALSDIGFKEKMSKKLDFFSLVNIAVFIRNKTLGHGSVTSISIDLLYIIDEIAVVLHNTFSLKFDLIYFYYQNNSVNYVLNSIHHKKFQTCFNDGFRYKRKLYRSEYVKINDGFIYVFDGYKKTEKEYINFINGKRIKPDLKLSSEFN
jgi:hypothetical protein